MTILADVSVNAAIKAFQRAGWVIQRKSGSHVVLAKEGVRELIVLPVHGGRALKRGLLLAAIRTAGLTPEGFRELL